MSFGYDTSTVKRTRSFVGDNTAALGKAADSETTEPKKTAPVTVQVEATLAAGTYTLSVTVDGQGASRGGVKPADLADTLASIIDRLAKHAAAGDLRKHRQPQEPVFRGSDFTRARRQDVFSG